MDRRLELHELLCDLLGNRNVYYQPTISVKMAYPAIKYDKSKIESRRADNTVYSSFKRYEITVIDRKPDNPVIEALLSLPYCGHDRHYIADNLHHDVLSLYY